MMTDILFPPWVRVSETSPSHVDNDAESRSIFTGSARTSSRTGKRWRFAFSTQNASDMTDPEKSALAVFASKCNKSNRVWMGKPGYRQLGSFPATELLTNNTFASGTTGWTGGSLTVSDRVMRQTATASGEFNFHQLSIAITQGRAYALRGFYSSFKTGATSLGTSISDSVISSFADYATPAVRLSTLSYAAIGSGTATVFPSVMYSGSGMAGDYVEVPFTSFARCFQVDNGPNLLTYSDQFDNAAWVKTECTITANGASAPDGSSDADILVENGATSGHYLSSPSIAVSASAMDYTFSIGVERNGRNWCWLQISEETSGTAAYAYFDLINGVVGATGVGANWISVGTSVRSMGGNKFAVTISARKTNAATNIRAFVGAASADNVLSYAGGSGTALNIWRATLAQSSVPTRLVQTTSAALPTGTAQTGNGIYVKAGPASATGSLLAGDLVQIGNQLQELTAPLNFDAAGLGYLQMHRPLRTSPADKAPVIVNNPMGYFVTVRNQHGSDDMPGNIANYDFEFEEALA